MPTSKKEQEVALLEQKLKTASGLVVTQFVGLSANDMVALRSQLREQGVEYRVVKNRLFKLAAERVGVPLDPFLDGPTGVCFGFDDPAVPFRAAQQLSKKYKPYKLNGGVFEGEVVGAEALDRLANLPTREGALTRLAGVLNAPVQKLAVALAGPARNLAVVLREVGQQK